MIDVSLARSGLVENYRNPVVVCEQVSNAFKLVCVDVSRLG